jgi:hypothetical protein
VIGAGASRDSLSESVLAKVSIADRDGWRPPLAAELFADRTTFGTALNRFPQCAGLVGDLRTKLQEGGILEHELELLQREAATYPRLHRELVALRVYLQLILWRCGTRWLEVSHGVTNYTNILRRLDKWRHANERPVCVVNFNYDLLFDEAAVATLGIDLGSIGAFVANEHYKYLKLHGSVNWGRRVPSPGGTHYSDPDHARRVLIDMAPTMEVSDDYILRSPEQPPSDSSPASILLPALAIPFETKSSFECPPSHLDVLDNCLRDVAKILVLGWRGAEPHFLDKLRLLPGLAPPVQIVGASDEGTRETQSHLASMGLAEDRVARFDSGFSNYLATSALEEFLA